MSECKIKCMFNSNNECWFACADKIRADERKNTLDEIYAIALNESHDTLIEWLQNNIQD